MRRIMSLWLGLMFFTCAVALADMSFDVVTTKGTAATLYVGSGPGNDSTTIQLAIDIAEAGDTVFVYSGEYDESPLIDKTLTLMGEDRETTIINGAGNTYGMHLSNADYINVSGFTVHSAQYNIQLSNVDHAVVSDNIIKYAWANAMRMVMSNYSLIDDNQFIGNTKGLLIRTHSNDNIVKNNSMNSTTNKSISIEDESHGNLVEGNQISGFDIGILVYAVENITLKNNMISDCVEGLTLIDMLDISISDNTFTNNDKAIKLLSASAQIVNCSLQDSISYDFVINDPDDYSPTVALLNTSFDENKVLIDHDTVSLNVKWFLHVIVVDESETPLAGIPVRVRDNENGSYDENFVTDSEGYVRGIPLTQYTQTQNGKTYLTPHNISAFNTTGQGYAIPEVPVDSSKEVTVTVYFDTDGDGIRDIDDKFPQDSTEWKDSDHDGVGDNSDDFPFDTNETTDSDGDGVGDNADVFPDDPRETIDTDGDGFGDNSDDFPFDPEEWNDADGDGHGDNEDEFPKDENEWRDSDGDGVGDNSDFLPQMDNGVFLMILAVIVIIIIVLLALLKPKSGEKPKKDEEENLEKTEELEEQMEEEKEDVEEELP